MDVSRHRRNLLPYYGVARCSLTSVRTKPKLQAAKVDHMNTIANSPERIKAYFRDAFVKYAA